MYIIYILLVRLTHVTILIGKLIKFPFPSWSTVTPMARDLFRHCVFVWGECLCGGDLFKIKVQKQSSLINVTLPIGLSQI
jgi:predicted 2-oxoglutarate/Fe(II)-dependent dioxygenase YbiX